MEALKDLPLENIVLFRPIYTDSGSCTELISKDAIPSLHRRSVDAVRAMLARKHTVDLEAQGQIISGYLKRRPPLPFFLPEPGNSKGGVIFVPLKMRKPRIVRDRAYGYVDLEYVSRLEVVKSRVKLQLVNGLTIDLFSSLTAARSSLSLGRDASAYFLSAEPSEEEQIVQVVRKLLGRLNRIEEHLEQLTR